MYALWTDEEIELLKKYYPFVEKAKIVKLLPDKSSSAITHKATRLGLKKEERWWSQKEIETLKNCYSTFSRSELLHVLPLKDWVNIRHKASALGLKLNPNLRYQRNWKKPEEIILSDIEKGYIAGILDGEGTIRICKHTTGLKNGGFYYSPTIAFFNTNGTMMGKIRDLLKTGNFCREDRINLKHKPRFSYTIASITGCKMVLEQIGDILIIKKPQAELLKEFLVIKANKEKGKVTYRETQLYELIKELNHRGI